MSAHVEQHRWQRRALRARRLAGERPALAETLHFYANLAEWQETLLHRHQQVIAQPSAVFAERLDPAAAIEALSELMAFLKRHAPAAIADETRITGQDTFDCWRDRIRMHWMTGGREAPDVTPIQRFILDALLQPFAESAAGPAPSAAFAADIHSGGRPRSSFCDRCGGLAVVALLREQAHGARRSLVCGFCSNEWPSPRLQCLHCGEMTVESLPVFRSDEFQSVRIDACESCKTYIKTLDLTRDGEASAIVDDIASMTLDIWAREHGYRRLRANVLGF